MNTNLTLGPGLKVVRQFLPFARTSWKDGAANLPIPTRWTEPPQPTRRTLPELKLGGEVPNATLQRLEMRKQRNALLRRRSLQVQRRGAEVLVPAARMRRGGSTRDKCGQQRLLPAAWHPSSPVTAKAMPKTAFCPPLVSRHPRKVFGRFTSPLYPRSSDRTYAARSAVDAARCTLRKRTR